jgi:diadenosine tetraphosphate (Ap4A) HIT family hydrolase
LEQTCLDSEFDKIIAGQRNGIQVIHEDELCIVIPDPNPVAKTHLLVIAKEKVTKMVTASTEIMGHLMLVAS